MALTFDQQTQQRQRFVKALASYLAKDLAGRSILLSLGDPAAQEWAAIRRTTPLFGYQDLVETERVLSEFLGVPQDAQP